MTPWFCRRSAHGQWHPVVRAHPLTGLTFHSAITAPGPPIRTETPTLINNGLLSAHKGNPLWTLFIPVPSVPGPILLLILTCSLRFVACSHINLMTVTTGQAHAVCLLLGKTPVHLMWDSNAIMFLKLVYEDPSAAPSHLQDWFWLQDFCSPWS